MKPNLQNFCTTSTEGQIPLTSTHTYTHTLSMYIPLGVTTLWWYFRLLGVTLVQHDMQELQHKHIFSQGSQRFRQKTFHNAHTHCWPLTIRCVTQKQIIYLLILMKPPLWVPTHTLALTTWWTHSFYSFHHVVWCLERECVNEYLMEERLWNISSCQTTMNQHFSRSSEQSHSRISTGFSFKETICDNFSPYHRK